MLRNRLSTSIVHSLAAMLLTLVLVGCIAAVPLIINAMDDRSTATLTVDVDAETLYAEAVKSIKARGIAEIKNEDAENLTIEGVRKGKNASMRVEAVGPDKSRLILTIEDDEDETALDEVVAAAQELCAELDLKCREQ